MNFTYNWKLSDLEKVKKNGLKAFTTFSCGGGADMGLLMSGFEVLGGCEIDKSILQYYNANFKHKFVYNEDIRDFVKKAQQRQLPGELYNLDLLHQSPPCSCFSISGDREKTWGKKKAFREGQKKQRLDDLFFEAIELVRQLRPKVATFENVEGLVKGKAKIYFNAIIGQLKCIGYQVQCFLIDGSDLGLPQKRKRLFFIAQRNDFFRKKIQLNFNEKKITFAQIFDSSCKDFYRPCDVSFNYYITRQKGDKNLQYCTSRIKNKKSFFNYGIVFDNKPCPTICGSSCYQLILDRCCRCINRNELLAAGSWPVDYNFLDAKLSHKCYLIGMSVPPLMMHKISQEIHKQLFL